MYCRVQQNGWTKWRDETACRTEKKKQEIDPRSQVQLIGLWYMTRFARSIMWNSFSTSLRWPRRLAPKLWKQLTGQRRENRDNGIKRIEFVWKWKPFLLAPTTTNEFGVWCTRVAVVGIFRPNISKGFMASSRRPFVFDMNALTLSSAIRQAYIDDYSSSSSNRFHIESTVSPSKKGMQGGKREDAVLLSLLRFPWVW